MGSIEVVRQPMVELMSIGFSEPIADQLYILLSLSMVTL